jgi:two-component system chemotaxis sensor kinase CheA
LAVSLEHINAEILLDFITESGELIDQLDQDLVRLESEANNLDLLNQIFRGIHTIKGSASFLSLDNLTQLAHGAEDALNLLRKGQITVTSKTMDALLAAADVLRGQIEELRNGQMCSPAAEELIARIKAISTAQEAKENAHEPEKPVQTSEDNSETVLEFSASKLDLLPFMVDDLKESLQQIHELIQQAASTDNTGNIASQLVDLTEGLVRSVDFYNIDQITNEVRCLETFSHKLADMADHCFTQAQPRCIALISVLFKRAEALGRERMITIPTEQLVDRLIRACNGEELSTEYCIPTSANIEQVLYCDHVVEHPTQTLSDKENGSNATQSADPSSNTAVKSTGGAGGNSNAAEQTIRVDVSRLESLLNLVGELVLQKNRVHSMARRVKSLTTDQTLCEEATQIASDLDRVTTDLQISVMKTRMQSMSKLFSRYPRVIRDLAKSTGKTINLQMDGGDTEVDKTVLEGLADPLVHILRNSADHGVEKPQDRLAKGKSAEGIINIRACHEGDHVLITIKDDGKGLDASKIGPIAVTKGLITEEELSTMTEQAIQRLVFAPGFSTAEQVSDLSGRGVGMDVVNSNISKLGGHVDVFSEVDKGTTVSIKIPLTVAIMHAMIVGIADETYAVPLPNLLEIVRPDANEISTIQGQPVMRLRNRVLPLVDLSRRFGKGDSKKLAPFALVVGMADHSVGLLVNELIGQQEVVIKPLDDLFDQSNAVSGATVREDGGVSLILDVAALVKTVEQITEPRRAA